MKLQLTLPPGLQTAMTRFDAMSLRERVLIGAALLASLLVLWDTALMQPLNAKRAALISILNADPNAVVPDTSQLAAGTADAPVDGAADPDPIGTALLQRESLRLQSVELNKQLQQVSAELIAPERMSEVLSDVLHQQPGVTLISLHNKPVSSLVPAPKSESEINQASTAVMATAVTQPLGPGPYQHPVELVIEGHYLDILNYVRALEALPWHLNWQSLELDSSHYPLNRARIELSTLSLDPAWLGT
jgi:MSHA biogenesis protein MshJ